MRTMLHADDAATLLEGWVWHFPGPPGRGRRVDCSSASPQSAAPHAASTSAEATGPHAAAAVTRRTNTQILHRLLILLRGICAQRTDHRDPYTFHSRALGALFFSQDTENIESIKQMLLHQLCIL